MRIFDPQLKKGYYYNEDIEKKTKNYVISNVYFNGHPVYKKH